MWWEHPWWFRLLLRPALRDTPMSGWLERLTEERKQVAQQHAAALAGATGLRRAVLELHSPNDDGSFAGCTGCDVQGWEAEQPDYPCHTYVLARDWPETDEVAAAVRRQVLTEAANAARNAFGDPAWSPTAQRFVSVASVIGEGS